MLLLCSACRDRRYMSFRGCSHSNRTKESIYSELKKSEKTTEPDWLSHRSRLIPMLNFAGTKKMPIGKRKIAFACLVIINALTFGQHLARPSIAFFA